MRIRFAIEKGGKPRYYLTVAGANDAAPKAVRLVNEQAVLMSLQCITDQPALLGFALEDAHDEAMVEAAVKGHVYGHMAVRRM